MPTLRSYVGEFTISLGFLNTTGKLYPMVKTEVNKAARLVNICPDCAEPTKPNQFYRCPKCGSEHGVSELDKAKEVDKELIRLTTDEIDSTTATTIEKNTVEITVHPRGEVWHNTYPGGTAYIFSPRSNNDKFFGLLLDILSDDQLAFIGTANIRETEKLVQISRWRDHVIVQQLLYPGDINEVESTPAPVSENTAMYKRIVTESAEPFNPNNYVRTHTQRLLALVAAKVGADVASWSTPSTTTTSTPAQDDEAAFLAALEASLKSKDK